MEVATKAPTSLHKHPKACKFDILTEDRESLNHLMPITEEEGPTTKRGSSGKRFRQPDTAFRGVRKRSWGRYVSEIRLPGQKTRVWLGSFGSPEMAARAYDSAAFFLKGTSANLNFPDLVHSLPRPLSSSRRDIQSAAAKAARELADERSGQDTSRSPAEPDSDEWWNRLGEDSVWTTTSFQDDLAKEEAPPLMTTPFCLTMDSASLGELTWNDHQLLNFNDESFLIQPLP